MRSIVAVAILALLSLGFPDGGLAAPSSLPAQSLADLAFDQHPGASLPLDTVLRDEAGMPIRLGEMIAGKPAILAFDYYRCPGLCGLVLDHVATALSDVPLRGGSDYSFIAISIDPTDTSADAAALIAKHLARGGFGARRDGVHFLTGSAEAVSAVAQAAGFPYRYDDAIAQFAHPAGIIAISAQGRIARYLLGIEYRPLDLRLALAEASEGITAAPAARLLLLCYSYDPANGRYSAAIGRLLQVTAALSVLGMGGLVLAASRGRRKPRRIGES